jgi:hypothetical protein
MAKKQDAAKRRKLVQSLVSASIVDKNGKEASPLGKLRLAFAAMEERGIVAEGRWWCCGTCGNYAMGDLWKQSAEHESPLGYCFFHEQDWDSYLADGTVYLAYQSFTGPSQCVGRIITDCLDSVGLEWEWNGSAKTRILVKLCDGEPMDRTWRRSKRLVKSIVSPKTKKKGT